MDFNNLKQDLVNKGVEKGKDELENLKGRFPDQKAGEQGAETRSKNPESAGPARSSSDQISSPSGSSEGTDTDLRESSRQSEVDAVSETEPSGDETEDIETGTDENAA